jgi:hypothetical protein
VCVSKPIHSLKQTAAHRRPKRQSAKANERLGTRKERMQPLANVPNESKAVISPT